MTDGDKLLAAIVANPDEDTPRLAYADWLDEQGDSPRAAGTSEGGSGVAWGPNSARAEFIRTQIAALTMHRDNARRANERCTALLDAHRDDWLADLPKVVRPLVRFERGFVGSLHIESRKMTRAKPPGWDRHPLRAVELSGRTADVTRLVQAGWLGRASRVEVRAFDHDDGDDLAAAVAANVTPAVRTLSFGAAGVGDRGAEALARCEAMPNLESLNVFASLQPSGWGALVTGPVVASVRRMHLTPSLNGIWNSPRCGPELAQALAESPRLGGLTELSITSHSIGSTGLRRVLGSQQLPSLRSLSVAYDRFDAGVWGVLGACTPPALDSLSVSICSLSGWGIEEFASSPLAEQLRVLDLRRNNLGPMAARALAASGPYPKLESLTLMATKLLDDGLHALARSDAFPALTELWVGHNEITDAGAGRLLSAPFADRLRRLSLTSNAVTPWMIDHLRKRFGAALEV